MSNIYNRIVHGKLRGLNSHDYHILLQQLLLVCLRNLGDFEMMGAIVRISRLFRCLCGKVIDSGIEEQLLVNATEVFVTLEKIFHIFSGRAFHLCSVHICWMYPYERYYKGLKSFVRNLAKPEGNMAQGYHVEEALGFITEYMSTYTLTSRRVWDNQVDPTITDEILEDKGRTRWLSDQVRRWVHNFVCKNVDALDPYCL